MESQPAVSFHKLFSFADRKDVVLMIAGAVAAMANGMAQPLMALFFGRLVNSFGGTDPSRVVHEVSKVSLLLVYLAIGAGIASLIQMTSWMVTGERQAARIRALYLKTILRQDIEFFDTQTTAGEVIGRMSGDTILIQEAMGEKVGKFIQLTSTVFGGFLIAFIKGWLLSLVLCSTIPILVAAGGLLSMTMAKMSSRSQAAYAEAGNIVEQTVGGIRTVSSYTGEKLAIEKYNSNLHLAYKASVKQGLASGLGLGVLIFVIFGSYALAVWYGSNLILKKKYTGGDVINVIMCIMMGGISLGQTSPSISAFASGKAAAYKMFETINRNPKIDASSAEGMVLEDINGEIELKDIHFRYPARPEVVIFDGFSLHVPCGKTVALVGQSGSGKSTVISLVERFYDPDLGEVLIDGISLKKLNLKWIRGNIGLVSQEPILFATTIKENILYGNEYATDDDIRQAIKLANAAKFIDKLPKGLNTNVGEHGTQLSGGQKQRIAIARAILKNPKILLLDEATSALDAESERVVQDALDNVMTNRTTIVVAHRLSTIRNAEIIAVVRSGKLLEQGTHDELIRNPDGAYSQLVSLQERSRNVDSNEGNDTEYRDDIEGRSLSRGSSRHSFKFSNGLPGLFTGIQKAEDEDEASKTNKGNSLTRKRVSIKRLAYLNKPELPYLIIGSLAAGINGVIFPVFGLLLSSAIKIFFEPPNELRKDSKFWSTMFLLLGVGTLVVLPMQNYFFGIAGGRLIQRIRFLSFKKVVHQEISWFDNPANSSGSIGTRLSSDASTVRSLVGDALGLIVQNIATVVAGLVIAFTANWLLAIVIVAVLPLIGLQSFIQMKFYNGFSADAKIMYEDANQIANDAVSSIRTVAAFSAEDKILKTYEKKCETPLKNGVRLGVVSGISFGVGSVALYSAQSFCFYIGAVLVQHHRAQFGEVFKVFFALTMAAAGVSQSTALTPDVNKVKDSVASIFQILDGEPAIDSSSEEGMTLSSVKGEIEFQHVSFRYPSRPDALIFNDLNLLIPSAKTVALVGESGSGKSTIISLIERFYNPDGGRITLDGAEIQKLKLGWLRQQMGLVSQEPVLFNETIRANIAYGGRHAATEEEITEAARSANAHGFICGLPHGYETKVGERGIQLSGGQKQRIAIARAVVRDPVILLLDEATSALDGESEKAVQEALDKVMVGRTCVVVAHRLATVMGADVIGVVKNGGICEKGSHEELMKRRDGVYASLVALTTHK